MSADSRFWLEPLRLRLLCSHRITISQDLNFIRPNSTPDILLTNRLYLFQNKKQILVSLQCTNLTTLFWYNTDILVKAFITLKFVQSLNKPHSNYHILSQVMVG